MTQLSEQTAAALKRTEQLMAFTQGNIEAFVKSSQIWAAGVQELGRSFAASAQTELSATLANVKAVLGAKSPNEVLDLQATFARSSLEKVVAETTKLINASTKLGEDTLAPITARVRLAAEAFGRTA